MLFMNGTYLWCNFKTETGAKVIKNLSHIYKEGLSKYYLRRNEENMPKDSQPDNKKARMEKANGQTPITRENQNQNRNSKKQSIKNNDV